MVLPHCDTCPSLNLKLRQGLNYAQNYTSPDHGQGIQQGSDIDSYCHGRRSNSQCTDQGKCILNCPLYHHIISNFVGKFWRLECSVNEVQGELAKWPLAWSSVILTWYQSNGSNHYKDQLFHIKPISNGPKQAGS